MTALEKTVNSEFREISCTSALKEEIILLQTVGNNHLVYKLIRGVYELENDAHVGFGFEINCTLFGEEENVKIIDVTTDINEAKNLYDLLVSNLVTPVSLMDIVEDFLTQKYS